MQQWGQNNVKNIESVVAHKCAGNVYVHILFFSIDFSLDLNVCNANSECSTKLNSSYNNI